MRYGAGPDLPSTSVKSVSSTPRREVPETRSGFLRFRDAALNVLAAISDYDAVHDDRVYQGGGKRIPRLVMVRR